uniref:Uncharacterized protein n=1 Tax=Panagrolaimus superbus TaxID=310955 RepID=A0A914Y9Y1_9BILA
MKVLSFNESKEITYFGNCKLQCNAVEKCLKLQMLDKAPQEVMISSYDRIYIRKSNFLCCLDQQSGIALVIILKTKESCEQIFNCVLKAKSHQPQSSNAVINEDELFKDTFYVPLIKQVQLHIQGYQELKIILLNFTNSLDFDERFVYLNILTDTLLIVAVEKNETCLNESRIGHYSMRKRSLNNISYKESDDESDESLPKKSKSSAFVKQPSAENSSIDVVFDIVADIIDGKVVKKLLIFSSNERKQCYEFVFYRGSRVYRCIGCSARQKSNVVKVVIHDDGSKTFEFNTIKKHICQPLDYLPENYRSSLILKSSNFELFHRPIRGTIRPVLIIFDPDNRNNFYKFYFDSSSKCFCCSDCRKEGTLFSARFIQHNGIKTLEFGFSQHRCQPKKNISQEL